MNIEKILNKDDSDLIYHNEEKLFIISAIISGLFWILVSVFTFGVALFYVLLFAISGIIMKYIFIANIRGYGIKVSENQFPKINKLTERISNAMNLKERPEVYIYQADGLLNAFALNIFSRNFVVITTEILDACDDDEELISFILGHEMSHIYRKHTSRLSLLLPSKLVPWLGTAYSRSCEYTCDALSVKYNQTNLEKVALGVTILATASKKRALLLNKENYIKQSDYVKTFWGGIAYGKATHPFTTLRLARLNELAGGDKISKPNSWGVFFSGIFSFQMEIIFVILFFAIFAGTGIISELKKFEASRTSEDNCYFDCYDECESNVSGDECYDNCWDVCYGE